MIYFEPQVKIVAGWHLLFTGANGRRCFGLTVENRVRKSASYSHQWPMNDYTFREDPAQVKSYIGLTDAEYAELERQLEILEKVPVV